MLDENNKGRLVTTVTINSPIKGPYTSVQSDITPLSRTISNIMFEYD